MTAHHRVKLSRIDDGQIVQIPKELEMAVDEVILRKVGSSIIVEPVQTKGLLELLATLEPIDEEFPEIDDPPAKPEDIF